MGSVAGAIEVLERIVRPLGAWAIVPGHGPVFKDAGPLDATLDYLKFVQDLASRALEAGLSPLEAARDADLGYFASWPDSERIVGNLHRACAELSGSPRGPLSTSQPRLVTGSPTTAEPRSRALPGYEKPHRSVTPRSAKPAAP